MGPLDVEGVASHMVEDGVTSILYLRNCAGVTTWIWVPQLTAADLLGEAAVEDRRGTLAEADTGVVPDQLGARLGVCAGADGVSY